MRASEARLPARSIHCRKVHGERAGQTAGPELVDVSAQSHTRDRGDGPFHRADACLQLALWLHHRSARPPRARLDWRDEQSDGRMDCTPDHRGFSLGVQHRDTSSATEIAFLAQSYDSASGPWAFETNLSHLARHGRTDLPND